MQAPISTETRDGGQFSAATSIDHRWLAAILVIFACLSFAYSLVLPLGEAADETDHFALVRFIAEQGRPPLTVDERASIGPKGDASPIYHALVALLTQHVDVSDLPDLPHTQRQPERFIPSDGFRANLIFHTEDETFPFHDIVLAWHLARLVSIPLGAATVLATYLTALAISRARLRPSSGPPWFALGAAAFVAFLPRFVISSAVVNDDNLVVPLVAFSVYFLVRIAQGDGRSRNFVVLGILMGAAAITKYHSLVLLPEVTLALFVLNWRNHWGWRKLLRGWGRTLLAFVLSAGWWFAFLVARFNQVADLGLVRGLMATLGDPVVTLGFGRILDFRPGGMPAYDFGWDDWARLLFRTFWIVYGWIHVFATPAVYGVLAGLSLAAVVGLLGLGWKWVAGRRPGRSLEYTDLALVGFHFFVYLGVVAMRYLLRPDPETAQGRHLYPAIASIAIFFVLGLSATLEALRRPSALFNRSGSAHTLSSERAYSAVALGLGCALALLSALTPSLFILPVYHPYLPIVTANAADVRISHRLETSFGRGVELAGYDLPQPEVEAGMALPLTLYWQVGERQERDYLVQTCLQDQAGEKVACRHGHPVDGRYPTRAWEAGYLVRDEIYLPLPQCLTAGDYELVLAVLPLLLDTPFAVVDEEAETQQPVSLGRIHVLAAPEMPAEGASVWLGDQRYYQGDIELRQIRQALTLIRYVSSPASGPRDLTALSLPPAGPDSGAPDRASALTWAPLDFDLAYPCPGGRVAIVTSHLVDPGVRPGHYSVAREEPGEPGVRLTVLTHPRNFTSPASIPVEVNATFLNEVKLLGYSTELSPRWPGDSIPITVHWQSLRTTNRNHIVGLHLLDNAMNTWGQTDRILGSHYPSVLWAPGENVGETYSLPISPQTPAGLYTIEFSLYDYVLGTFHYLPVKTDARPEPVEHLYIGPVRVMDPARNNPPAHPLTVRLGGQIDLLGYDLSSAELRTGQALHLALHWEAISRPAADYTVFTQLIGPDGLVWGQQDNQPQGGRYPTSAWAVQDRVVDRYELRLREGAPPGEYRLLVGMYDLATGRRLAATGADGSPLPDSAIPLATLTLE
jgi:hypothetical protein